MHDNLCQNACASFEIGGILVITDASTDECKNVLKERVLLLAIALSTCPRNAKIPNDILNSVRKKAWSSCTGAKY
jgi:hypothetical protein